MREWWLTKERRVLLRKIIVIGKKTNLLKWRDICKEEYIYAKRSQHALNTHLCCWWLLTFSATSFKIATLVEVGLLALLISSISSSWELIGRVREWKAKLGRNFLDFAGGLLFLLVKGDEEGGDKTSGGSIPAQRRVINCWWLPKCVVDTLCFFFESVESYNCSNSKWMRIELIKRV